MPKLVCDRCGVVYTDKESIDRAKEGKAKWEAQVRADGDEPRGLCPCPWLSCDGELQLKEI